MESILTKKDCIELRKIEEEAYREMNKLFKKNKAKHKSMDYVIIKNSFDDVNKKMKYKVDCA